MSKCSSAFLPAQAHLASVYSAVVLFCCSETTSEKKEGRMRKLLLYFTLIWGFIHLDSHWSKKMILLPITLEAFRGRKKEPFAFNCFPFILNEQCLVLWNSRQSVRLVQKVSQTSNKGNNESSLWVVFFSGFFFRFLLCLRLTKQ